MDFSQYLVDKKEEIASHNVKKRYLSVKPDENYISVIFGPRRAGKTYFLYFLIKDLRLKPEDYLFVDFEDDVVRFSENKVKRNPVKSHIEIYGKEPQYLFFDEIQSLENWNSFLYSLVEKHVYKIVVSGSSSKLLSREIATQLRGRSLSFPLFPFSFKEFLEVKGVEVSPILTTKHKAVVLNLLNQWLVNGGFPQVVLEKIQPALFFREYLNMVVYRDLVERFSIKNTEIIRFLMASVIQSFGKEFSLNRVFNQLKQRVKVSKNTVYDYFSHLKDVFFAFSLHKFDYSERKSLLSIPKVYLIDTGLANIEGFSKNIGRLMENVVFLGLKKRELIGEIRLYYWKDVQHREVDFVVVKDEKVRQLIQVTYTSSLDDIEQREFRALVKAGNELNCNELYIITWDFEGEKSIKGKKIQLIPLWKWLLEIDKGS